MPVQVAEAPAIRAWTKDVKEAMKNLRMDPKFAARNVKVKHVWIGEFATAMEMAGASISVLKLDAELDRLMAAPARTPFFTHVGR